MDSRFVPKVESPCPRAKEAVASGEKSWFCDSCQLPVHNFSVLTPGEQVRLLAGRAGRVCIAYRKSEGAVPVEVGSWVLLHRALRPWRWVVATLVVFLPLVSAAEAAGKTKANRLKGRAEEGKQVKWVSRNDITGGVVCEPEPLWHRVLFFWRR